MRKNLIKQMRKNFIVSWSQAVVLLLIAGTILFHPVFDPWRIAWGTLLVVFVAAGVGIKLANRRRYSTESRQRERTGDDTPNE